MRKMAGLLFLTLMSLSLASAQTGSSPSISPFSWIVNSSTKGYRVAVVSKYSIDKYEEDIREGWDKANLSKEQKEKLLKDLRSSLRFERQIRERYKVSGLYKGSDSDPSLVKEIQIPEEFDRLYVSDRGDFVVAVNLHVARGMNENPTNEELRNTNQPAVGVFYASDTPPCFYSLANLIRPGDSISRGVHGFEWSGEEPLNVDDSGVFELNKLNGHKIRMDAFRCSVADEQPDSDPTSPERDDGAQNKVCLSIFVFLFASLISLVHRF